MKQQSNLNTVANRWTIVLFVIYLIALYWILLLKLGVHFSYMGNRRTNLLPFGDTSIITGENILNVVIFVPLGVYARVLFRRWAFGKKILFVFSISLLVEGLQYIFRIGAFDVTDIITNTVGGLLGILIYKGLEKAFNNNVKAQKFINKMAAAGTALMILLLILLKMNMLPIRYQ